MSATGVMTTIGITVAATESKNLLERHTLTMRPVVAGFLLGLFLFPLDASNPELSKQFQTLIIVSALLLNGGSLFQLITKSVNSAKA